MGVHCSKHHNNAAKCNSVPCEYHHEKCYPEKEFANQYKTKAKCESIVDLGQGKKILRWESGKCNVMYDLPAAPTTAARTTAAPTTAAPTTAAPTTAARTTAAPTTAAPTTAAPTTAAPTTAAPTTAAPTTAAPTTPPGSNPAESITIEKRWLILVIVILALLMLSSAGAVFMKK